MRKVHLRLKSATKERVTSKLLSVIKGQRQALHFVGSQHLQDGSADRGRITVGQTAH